MNDEQMPIVSYSITRTVNLGNYESVRIQAGLTLNAEAYMRAKKFVDSRIEKEVDKWNQ